MGSKWTPIFYWKIIIVHSKRQHPQEFFQVGKQRRARKGVAAWGFQGTELPGRRRSFQKRSKISMKNLQLYKIFASKFRDFFKGFLKLYRIFGENSDKVLEMCICRGLVAAAPTLANLWKSQQKNQWKPANFGQF